MLQALGADERQAQERGRTAGTLPHDTSPRQEALPGAPLCSADGCAGEAQSPGAVTAFRATSGPGGRRTRGPGGGRLRSARPGRALPPRAGRGRGGRLAGSLFLLHGGYLNVLLSITRHFLHRRQLPGPHAGAGAPHIMGAATRSPAAPARPSRLSRGPPTCSFV